MLRKVLPFIALLVVASTAHAQAPAADKEAALKRGKLLFIQCRACHTLKEGEPQLMGPNLSGFMNRKAASAPGYTNYSAALKKSNLKWDRATLDKWLESPAKLVPGNMMAYPGTPAPADRAALITYLEAETAPAKK